MIKLSSFDVELKFKFRCAHTVSVIDRSTQSKISRDTLTHTDYKLYVKNTVVLLLACHKQDCYKKKQLINHINVFLY